MEQGNVQASEILFPGQQEGERIYFVITPHWIRRVFDFLTAFTLSLSVFFLTYRFSESLTFIGEPVYVLTGGTILSIIIFMSVYGWLTLVTNALKGFITDRRFMRLELMFPWFILKRSLFWNEVGKVKGYERNVIFRLLNIGKIGLTPIAVQGAALDMRHVHYFEDLANYIDKILYLYKNKPHELIDLRPFVAKPAGKRY